MFRNVKRVIPFLLGLFFVVLLAVPAYASESFAINTLEQRGSNYVFLEWDECVDADGYSLYRCEDDETFRLIKNVVSCSTYNYSLENGKTYSYMVRPYQILDDGSREYLTESESISIQIGVKTPDNLNVTIAGAKSMSVSWNGDPLADYYLLYRSTDNSNWTLVKSVYGVNTVTYGLTEGENYYFRVKAVRTINGVVRYSNYSNSVGCILGIAAPGNLTVKSANKNSVALEWDSVAGATGYRLYRAENDGAYVLVKTVTGTTTKNYNLSSDITYTYRIAAIMEGETHTYKSNYTYSEPIRLMLDSVENLRVEKYLSSGVSLSWDPVEGATGYRLYRTGEDGVARLVKTVSENTTNTYSLVTGQCYGFSIKPICKSGAVTVNGSVSEDVTIFFTNLPVLSVTQQEVNKVQLSWSSATDAESYSVSISQNGSTESIDAFAETEMEYKLSGYGEVSISLWAMKGGIESATVSTAFTPVYEEKLTFSITDAIDETHISLAWKPAENAIQYEVQRFDEAENAFVTVGECTTVSFTDANVSPNTTYQYRYRVEYGNSVNSFWGNWSETVSVTTPSAPQYRALLIGEENYETVLNGPLNDIEAMDNMLSGMTAMNWDIYLQADATRDEIVSLISLAFADASENDVSLFYYSGHGVTGSGDYYSGALMTVDYNYIPMQDLAELLSVIPGKVIVILDSCGSGAAISGGTEAASTYSADDRSVFDPASFNTQVVQAFSQYNENEQTKSAELATSKFYVLTSSAYEQNSRSICIDNVWGGVFTRAFVGSVGYDYNSKSWNGSMNADENADDCVTLSECYVYCCSEASEYQDVQVYPLDSSVRLLYK